MTAAAVSTGSLSDVSHRLGHLLNDRTTMAQWWVDLAGELDELAARLMADSQSAWQALQGQLTLDAPHLSSQLRRIDAEQEDLQSQVLRVRVLTGLSAGDPESARTVRAAVRDLLHRLRRVEERTTGVLYDAYGRDFGGE